MRRSEVSGVDLTVVWACVKCAWQKNLVPEIDSMEQVVFKIVSD